MKDLYCVKCIALTPHSGEVDQNGEFIFTCSACGTFLKFPQVEEAGQLEGMLGEVEVANKNMAESRQVADAQNAILSQVLTDGTQIDVTATPDETPVATA